MTPEARLIALHEIEGAGEYLSRAIDLAGAVPDDAPEPGTIRCVGILGAGTMGRGIAMAFAQTGRSVVLIDPSGEALNAARTHLEGLADRALSKGRLDASGHASLLARITYADDISAFTGRDMVIEAVPEIMALKQEVLAKIEAVVAPETLITSNTSTLDVDQIAGVLKHPGRFIGTHFFLPAQVNKLLELVPAETTTAGMQTLTLALAKTLGKRAVIAANGDGFIGNRLFDRFHQEAMYLVEEGAWPEEVDSALEAHGFAIGPFRALDLVGNDIPWGVRKQRAERPNPPHQPRIGDALCEANMYGQKTGSGWYLYDAATPKGRPHEAAHALILREAQALGLYRRRISRNEIVGRCLTALIVEGLAMLEEGRAARASDIDMVYVTGYGFPPGLGGPMRLGEEIGRGGILALARHYGEVSGRGETAWALPISLAKGEELA